MNLRNKISVIVLIILSGFTGLKAQNIDQERMNRDINVSKNILRELFKTDWNTNGTNAEVVSVSFGVGQFDNISGMYVPDYGVIFKILGGSPDYITKTDTKGNTVSYEFKNEGEKVTKESIIKRSEKFLRDYSPTIGQLKNENKITLMYLGSNQNNFSLIHFSSGNKDSKNKNKQQLPSLLVSVNKKDLKAYKKGKISEKEINNRIKVSEKNKQNAGHQDVKIMNSIFKTTFKEPGDHKYHISSSNYTYIDNLGALFSVVASYGTGFDSIESSLGKIRIKLAKIFEEDSNRTQLVVVNGDTVKGHLIDKNAISGGIAHLNTVSDSSSADQSQSKKRTNTYQFFLQQLKETIVDYGQTLRSIQPKEQVFISVRLNGSNNEIPDRLTLQIKKSVLEALDKSTISREQAMNKITVREY